MSATKFVHIKRDRDREMLAKRNVNFFLFLLFQTEGVRMSYLDLN